MPGLLDRCAAAGRALFGYDAALSTPKRRPPTLTLRSEDAELLPGQRTALVSTTRDLPRNMAVAAFAVRKHLDYITNVVFEPRNSDEKLNARLKELTASWSHRRNSDVCQRHNLWRQIRIAEACATIDGDVGAIKLRNGALQWIEGDRVRNPWGLGMIWADNDAGPRLEGFPEGTRLINGVVVNPQGKALGYAIAKRGPFGTQFLPERIVPARNFLLHAYFTRFDQLRGVSPLSSALNDFRDIHECTEYALAKAKVAQLFGLKIKRAESDELPLAERQSDVTEATDAGYEASADGTIPPEQRYQLDFGRGPFMLDLDPGDDADILESGTPSTEFQAFMGTMILIALKSLDIPHCLFDESESAWSSCRSAWMQYEDSARSKRANLRDLLDEILRWKVASWVASGLLELPPRMTADEIRWEWLFPGVPWIDLLKEMQSNQLALALRLKSRTRILREQQQEFADVVAELEQEEQLLEDKGLAISIAPPGIAPAKQDDGEESPKKKKKGVRS